MTFLSKQLNNTFNRILLEQKDEILKNIKLNELEMKTEKDEILDESDLASNDVSQGMQMRLGNRKSLYLKKINAALERIKSGSYGECKDCGDEINLKRLKARPTAELCIVCKEESEKRENLSADGRKHKSVGKSVSLKAI